MKISPININRQSYKPSSKGNNREVYNQSGKFLYKTTTYFFRDDLNWSNFVDLLKEKYKTTPKINIINHACSNGQESYSLVIKLMQKLGKEVEKFLPIQAKDIDIDNIASAIRGHLGIKLHDIYRINSYTNNNITTYFNYGEASNPNSDLVLIPKENIKDKVIFNQSDILKDSDKKLPNNTILLCRNLWPYLKLTDREMLAQKLWKNFGKNSLLAIGDFDDKSNTAQLLKKQGFVETGVSRVYTKP